MNELKTFRNIEASLLKFCNDLIREKGWDNTFKPFNFDTHALINALPNADLLGIAELSLVEDEGTYDGTVTFVASTQNDDTNLQKLREVIDVLFDKLSAGSREIRLVENDSGQARGNLIVKRGTTVLPVAKDAKGRPVQVILVHFGCAMRTAP